MITNIGSIDRTLRLIAGLVIIVLGIYFKSWWGLVGIIPLTTATLKSCPLYLPFGITTCKMKTGEDK